MSLNRKRELRVGAKEVARELRKRSTPAEKILWEALRANRLHGFAFHRQRPIYHDITGRESFFIADFYCHQARLVIEIDGGIHEVHAEEDRERTRIMNLLGLNVIRFTNLQVLENLQEVLHTITLSCSRAHSEPLPLAPRPRQTVILLLMAGWRTTRSGGPPLHPLERITTTIAPPPLRKLNPVQGRGTEGEVEKKRTTFRPSCPARRRMTAITDCICHLLFNLLIS